MVKCFTCKQEIDKKESVSYLEEGKKTPKYYCNQNHLQVRLDKLEQDELKQIEKDKFNELDVYIASDILQYEIGQITPPNLKKRVQKLRESYSYEVIRLCFELMQEQLSYYISKNEFNNEQHLVNYIMVVINNNINDAYLIWKRRLEMVDKSKKLEEDLSIFNANHESVNRVVKKSKSKDISLFLMEDDL